MFSDPKIVNTSRVFGSENGDHFHGFHIRKWWTLPELSDPKIVNTSRVLQIRTLLQMARIFGGALPRALIQKHVLAIVLDLSECSFWGSNAQTCLCKWPGSLGVLLLELSNKNIVWQLYCIFRGAPCGALRQKHGFANDPDLWGCSF